MDKYLYAHLFAQNVKRFSPVVNLQTEERAPNVEAVEAMTQHDRIPRKNNVVVDLWVLHHIVNATNTSGALRSSLMRYIRTRRLVLGSMLRCSEERREGTRQTV